MKCPFCGYRRKKEAQTPHWQCPKCEKAYNKFQSKPLARDSGFERPVSDKEKLQDFITNFTTNAKGILTIAASIFFLFWGIDEFLTEGVFYVSNYYEQYQIHQQSDWFVFSTLLLILIFLIGIVLFIGRKVFKLLSWF